MKSSHQPRNPSDMLSTLTPSPTAQSIPPRTRATALPPSMTIADASFASGAMPTLRPWTGRPAIVAAVCVPCSPLSRGAGVGVSSAPSRSNSA